MHVLRYLLVLVFLGMPLTALAGGKMPVNQLHIDFDLAAQTLRGVSKISSPGTELKVDLRGLKVISASVNTKNMIIETGTENIVFRPEGPDDLLTIEYEAGSGSFADMERSKNPGVVQGNLIHTDGVVLTDSWHPVVEGLSVYQLTAVLPNEFEALSEADEIIVQEKTDVSREFSFVFSHPVQAINFVASRYLIESETHNGTAIYTYFFPEDRELAKNYLEHAKKYFDLYKRLIGEYPYKRFSVVENILPTGYSMPTFTLLGRDVVRLPFIAETSLGHEILHQWFGNLVYIDYKSGNWAEGLTTYLADHLFEENKGKGWEYRKQALISFQSYITGENDLPLKAFFSRTGRASSSVGYGKSAMVFHMLKNLAGEDIFYKALGFFIQKNRFAAASWKDIEDAFVFASGKDLGWFFRQWVDEKGMPELELKNIKLRYQGLKTIVSFELSQKGQNFKIPVPVTVRTRDSEFRKWVDIEKETTVAEFETDSTPLEIIIDRDYDLFRKLSEKEMPPVISRLLGSKNRLFVFPRDSYEAYQTLYELLKEEGFASKKEEEVTYDDIRSSSLFVPGIETALVKRLFGRIEKQPADFFLIAKKNPLNPEEVIAVFDGEQASVFAQYIPRITHYGKFSSVSFTGGKNTAKSTDQTARGIRREVSDPVIGLEVPRIINLTDVIESAASKKIIYVGESHDRFEHHRVQLEVIRELHRKNKNIAIGMEMFQKPFQEALDKYIAGEISEKEFLKKSEYFKRWVFDYNLYREILLYARDHKIPVIALNIRREIVSKVSAEGLQSLSPDESREVPDQMDLSDAEYRARLRDYFEKHAGSEKRNFDFFHQAQVLWDESMAQGIDEFMKKNPEYQVVVLAGVGHMAFGSGIPKRVYRLNRKEYSVILNYADIEKDVADFILFPSPVQAPESPRLMVLLKEEDGKVKITDFSPDSISEKAGLRKDDIILSLDDVKIEGIDDVKIFLLYKKSGDDVKVKVSRERLFFGPAELEFAIKL